MADKELIKIVEEAIPLDPKCQIQRNYDIHRRDKLMRKIKEYVAKQLEAQFNAKEVA